MLPAIRSELKKLLTIRSTYVITFLAVAFNILIAGYARGYKLSGHELTMTDQLSASIQYGVTLGSVFCSLIAVLFITHEYRYNTILYSLVARKRSIFIASKFITVTILSLLFTILMSILAVILTEIGVHIAGHSLVAQQIVYSDIVWRYLFFGWGYSIIALLIGFLLRNQIGSIMVLFLVPSTIEGLLSILLKSKAVYLPFTALNSVIDKSVTVSYGKAALVFLAYLIIGWAIATALFMKRDAN